MKPNKARQDPAEFGLAIRVSMVHWPRVTFATTNWALFGVIFGLTLNMNYKVPLGEDIFSKFTKLQEIYYKTGRGESFVSSDRKIST